MYWSGETATTTKKDKKRKKKRKKEEKKERVTGGGGGGTTVIVQFDTLRLDTKASRVGPSTTSMGSEFQSLMVLGRKEEPLYWVLVVSRVNCLSWVAGYAEYCSCRSCEQYITRIRYIMQSAQCR